MTRAAILCSVMGVGITRVSPNYKMHALHLHAVISNYHFCMGVWGCLNCRHVDSVWQTNA